MKKILICYLVFSMLFLTGCGHIYRTGDADYYYEHGQYVSSFGTGSHFVYSPDFVKKFETTNASFHHYVPSGSLLCPLGEYDISILSMTYLSHNYELAKQDLFDNTEYVSEEPNYVYNDYDFYIIMSHIDDDSYKYVNAFSDTKNAIVLMGIWISTESNINLDIPEEEWPEFLRTYYGEYYDFDA